METPLAINIKWDCEAGVWVAINNDIGLALESGSYDALVERIKVAVPELLELNNIKVDLKLNLFTEMRRMVC